MKSKEFNILLANIYLAAAIDVKEIKMAVAFVYIIFSLFTKEEGNSKEGEQ